MQSSLNVKGWHEGGSFVTLETLNFFKKDFYPEIRNSSKLSFFFPSLSHGDPFHRVKKIPR